MKEGLRENYTSTIKVGGKEVEITPVEWCPMPKSNHRLLLTKATPKGERTEWWIVGTFRLEPLCRFDDEDFAHLLWAMLKCGARTLLSTDAIADDKFDVDRIENDVKEFIKQGKSVDEIKDIMKGRMKEYRKDDGKEDKKKGW